MIDTVRRYRVLADVDVHVHDLDEADLRDHWAKMRRSAPPESVLRRVSDAEFVRHERRLFDAVLRDRETLDRWLVHEANVCIACEDELVGPTPFVEDTIAPLLPRLPAAQRAYIERMVALDEVEMALDLLFMATDVTVISVALRQLPVPGPPCEAGHVVEQRAYRAAVDLQTEFVEIDNVDLGPWQENFEESCRDELGLTLPEFIGHQRVLRDAIVRDESILDAWMQAEIASKIENGALETYGNSIMTDEELFGPLIARMSPRPREYFGRAADEQRLFWGVGRVVDAVRTSVLLAHTVPASALQSADFVDPGRS